MDANKGITSITYNHLNLPTKVTFATGNIEYIYDASGVKQKKIVTETGNPTITTEYAGNYIYQGNALQFFNHAEGYVEPDGSNGYNYIYQYKDHLGNIRLSYTDADGNGSINASTEIVEENNYYPFGLKHSGYNNVKIGRDHKFGFGSKEEQDELGLGWIDITARNYDPALGRWMNLDPLAEMMTRHSPYNYAFNNPIYFIDYDGMAPESGEQNPSDEEKENKEDDTPWWLKWVAVLFSDDTEKMNSQGNVTKEELKEKKEEKIMDAVEKTNQDFNDTFSITVKSNSSVKYKSEDSNFTIVEVGGKLTISLIDGFEFDGDFGFLEPDIPSFDNLSVSVNSGSLGANFSGTIVDNGDGTSYAETKTGVRVLIFNAQYKDTKESGTVSVGVGGAVSKEAYGLSFKSSGSASLNMELKKRNNP